MHGRLLVLVLAILMIVISTAVAVAEPYFLADAIMKAVADRTGASEETARMAIEEATRPHWVQRAIFYSSPWLCLVIYCLWSGSRTVVQGYSGDSSKLAVS
jgi:hypothetical protein